MGAIFPIWRSMLFIPAHQEKFHAKAHLRGADAYILDLEDSVPALEKPAARALLKTAAQQVSQGGAAALVRINSMWDLILLDLDAAVLPEIHAIVIPKAENAAVLNDIAGRLDSLEAERGIPAGQIYLIAQIEDVQALPKLDEIANASPRLLGMILGSEDFSASAGMEPTAQNLFMPNQMVQFACRRAGILPLGFPASIADYRDGDAFRQTIRLARQMGFAGAFCVHPSQVAALNEEFSPSAHEIAQAQRIVAAYEQGLQAGRGAVAHEGKMIDLPVVLRAREMLRRSAAVAKDVAQ